MHAGQNGQAPRRRSGPGWQRGWPSCGPKEASQTPRPDPICTARFCDVKLDPFKTSCGSLAGIG